MELLRKKLEEEFSKNGNTQRALRLSRRLDKLVAKEQKKILKEIRNECCNINWSIN